MQAISPPLALKWTQTGSRGRYCVSTDVTGKMHAAFPRAAQPHDMEDM